MKRMNLLTKSMIASLCMIPFTAMALTNPVPDTENYTIAGAIGNLSGKLQAASVSGSTSNDTQYLGFKLGYSSLPENSLGFIGRATLYTKMSGAGWADYMAIRPEVNAAFRFSEQAYAFGGINLNSFLSSATFSSFGMGKGFQIGAGVNFTSNSFAEIQYISSSHDFTTSGQNVSLSLSGLEVSIGHKF